MRARRSYKDRMTLALHLLADERYDALLQSPPRHFSQLPTLMAGLAEGRSDVMCQLITYRQIQS